eukprot:scaffold52738_cov65-Attheya_sp.AAC.3
MRGHIPCVHSVMKTESGLVNMIARALDHIHQSRETGWVVADKQILARNRRTVVGHCKEMKVSLDHWPMIMMGVYTATWARYMDMAELDRMEWVPMLVRKLNVLVIGSYMVLTVDSELVLGNYGW